MMTNLMTKNGEQKTYFICECCAFKTQQKSDYERHISTVKHHKMTKLMTKNGNNDERSTRHKCDCGNIYSSRQGLHRHKKKCNYDHNQEVVSNNGSIYQVTESQQPTSTGVSDETMIAILHQTTELTNLVKEQQKQIQEQQEQHNKQIQELIPQLQQVTNINNNNCNNKFNLNFFLNEQCKDAISIQHFIENLNIGIRELEHMGDVGYVKGMMSIFSETLGKMNIYERPLHCTDLKRDTLYIKQGDTWMKDTEDKTELKKLVETVKCRNYGSLRLWEREHPEAFECDTQDNIDYMRISSESLGGFNSTDSIKLNKIIKHVVKEVYVK